MSVRVCQAEVTSVDTHDVCMYLFVVQNSFIWMTVDASRNVCNRQTENYPKMINGICNVLVYALVYCFERVRLNIMQTFHKTDSVKHSPRIMIDAIELVVVFFCANRATI